MHDKEPHDNKTVSTDINIEKWPIFGTKYHGGHRVQSREETLPDGGKATRKVTVGLPDSPTTLTVQDYKCFVALVDLWHRQGRNVRGVVTTSINRLLNALIPHTTNGNGAIKVRRGTVAKEWLIRKIDRMLTVPIVFEYSYQNKDGSYRMKESLTLISQAAIFDRKNDAQRRYLGVSSVQIHPVIIKSILGLKTKPVRLDVVLQLRRDVSVILYRYLDLVMADKTWFKKELKPLAEELGFGASRFDNLVRQFRDACAELQGCEFTTGRIALARVEHNTASGRWFLFVRKAKRNRETVREARIDEVEEQRRFDRDKRALLAAYEALDGHHKQKVNDRANEIFRTSFHGLGGDLSREFAILEAMKELRGNGEGK